MSCESLSRIETVGQKILSLEGDHMKKTVFIIVLVLALGAGVYFIFFRGDEEPKTTETPQNTVQGIEVDGEFRIINDACQLFVQTDADTVLGAGSVKSTTASADTSSDDIKVSNCTYTYNISPGDLPVTDYIVTASIVSRSARTTTGAESNESHFVSLPEGAEVVEGYGEAAYWNPQFGQLNILKGNNWYILSNGPAVVGERTLNDALKLADTLLAKL